MKLLKGVGTILPTPFKGNWNHRLVEVLALSNLTLSASKQDRRGGDQALRGGGQTLQVLRENVLSLASLFAVLVAFAKLLVGHAAVVRLVDDLHQTGVERHAVNSHGLATHLHSTF